MRHRTMSCSLALWGGLKRQWQTTKQVQLPGDALYLAMQLGKGEREEEQWQVPKHDVDEKNFE